MEAIRLKFLAAQVNSSQLNQKRSRKSFKLWIRRQRRSNGKDVNEDLIRGYDIFTNRCNRF